jgi:probable rRNA maturation factor
LKRPIAIRCLHPRLRLDRRAIVRAFRTLDRNRVALSTPDSGLGADGELSLVFLTDAALARLHGDFLADPSPTDVITFPGPPPPGPAGEICVSADAARRRRPRGDWSAELTLYLVHGWLHLAGHDDRAPVPRRAMRRAEAVAMAALRREGAVPPFSFLPSSPRTRRLA